MGERKIVTIHSYRGGTGKSNMTANIAVCAQAVGSRLCASMRAGALSPSWWSRPRTSPRRIISASMAMYNTSSIKGHMGAKSCCKSLANGSRRACARSHRRRKQWRRSYW